MNRICTKCKVEKNVSNFYKRNNRGNGISGYHSICKNCKKNKKDENHTELTSSGAQDIKNKFDKKEYNKKYRETHKEKLNEYSKDYRKNNKEKIEVTRRIYYENNKTIITKKNYEYCLERSKRDPLFKLTRCVRSLIKISFKSQYTEKASKTIEILGCTFEEFKSFIELQFDESMNWENQGSYWHLDHIIPISSAKTIEDVYKLNHFTNFRPLYWLDNLKKGNRII